MSPVPSAEGVDVLAGPAPSALPCHTPALPRHSAQQPPASRRHFTPLPWKRPCQKSLRLPPPPLQRDAQGAMKQCRGGSAGFTHPKTRPHGEVQTPCTRGSPSVPTGGLRAVGTREGDVQGRRAGWRSPRLGYSGGLRPCTAAPQARAGVSVNRKSAAPESEAVALFISRQPGSPPPPLSSNSSFLCRQLVRLPRARPAPGTGTALGREPRAPGWDGVTPSSRVHGGGQDRDASQWVSPSAMHSTSSGRPRCPRHSAPSCCHNNVELCGLRGPRTGAGGSGAPRTPRPHTAAGRGG